MFTQYLRDLPLIVGSYGGAADLNLPQTAVWADRLALPDIANLVRYTDKQAFERFGARPRVSEGSSRCVPGRWT
jgi:hypothetical protein